MKTKSYYFVLLALLSLSITPREVLGQQDRNTVKEPYSMSVQALRGALGTEVCVTINSIDPQKYPLPTSIKQLVADPDDGPKYRLEKYTGDDIPLTNGRTTFVLRGYENCQSFNVKVHFKLERWHDEHLEDDIHVCSKPNLSIEKIVAPEQTYVNTPFNVQAVIRESKGDAGATTTVTLYEGSSVLGSFTNVVVPKGGTVNVVFQGISATTPGKHYYTIKISNTDPPEFDVTNNSRSFSVNVLGRPDLKVEKITVPEKVFANDAFDIQAFIRETTGSSDVKATVSLYDGSTLIGSISRVDVRDGSTEVVKFRDVKATTTGQHSYTVTISNANPAESDGTNNSLTVAVTVLLKPDLVVESATAPSPIFASTFFDVDAVIRELNGQCGATATATLYEGKSIQALPRKVTVSAGGTAHVLFQGIKESAGTHTYIIKLSDVEPSETNEANNTYTFSLVVVLRPDLKVDKVTSPQSVTVKVPFNVDAIIKEIDGQSGTSATVTLYEGPTSLGSFPNISVPASGSATVSFPGIIATSQGNHNYTVKITNANPAESDVSNNNYSFSLTAVAKPDLVVDNITAPASIPAGTPFDLTAAIKELLGVVGASATVTLYDASNVAVGTPQSVVVAAGGSKNVVFSGITASASGTYTVKISGSSPAESNTLNNDKSVSITVTAGTVSLSQSIVTISPSTVVSGSTATITLQAKDAAGNNLTTGGLAVGFSASGGGTVTTTTDNGNGTYIATFTATTAGTATVSATIGGSPVTSTIPPITVTAGAVSLSQSIVTISPSTVASGSTATITLQAKDAAENNLTTGGLAVGFSASGGGTVTTTTDNGNGTYIATFTATTAGTATVSATIGGSPITSTIPPITVTAGAVSLSQSIVTISPSTVASGTDATITLQAKDAAGNNLTTGGLSVAFSATGGGTIGSVSYNGNGVYTATFTGVTAGTSTLSATIDGSLVTSPSPTITVTAGAVSLSQSIVTISPSTVASESPATITLQAKDAAGNNLTTGGLTVVFSLTGAGTSSGTIGGVTDNLDGTYSGAFTGTTAGTAKTVSATIGGSAITSALPTITVTVGAVSLTQSIVTISPSTVASGSTALITLQAKDGAGNNLTAGDLTVVFSLTGAGTSSGTIGGVTDNGNGTYSATFTATTVGTATISATIGGSPVTSTIPSITITVGAVSLSQSIVTTSPSTVPSGTMATITLQAKDAAGNNLTSGGLTVAFSLTGVGTIGSVTDNGNGTYSVTFTATTVGTAMISATIGGSPVTSTIPSITVTPGAVSLSQSIVTISPSTVASGSTATITLQAKDAAGNNLTTGGLLVAFSAMGVGTVGPVTYSGNGIYTATFTGTTGGSSAVTATIGGSPVISTLPTITVVAPVVMTAELHYFYYNTVNSWDEVGVRTYYDSVVTDNSTFSADAGATSASLPSAPINAISWNIETSGGGFDQESFTNPARTGGDANSDIYWASGLNNKGISYTLTINRNNGTIHFRLDQANSGGYHSWKDSDGRHVTINPPGVLRPGSTISFTLLVQCGFESWVSMTSISVPPLSPDQNVPRTDVEGNPVYDVDLNGYYTRWTRYGANVTSDVIIVESRKLPGKDVIAEDAAEGSALPTVYSLYQNYPNPFNPATNIAFSLANSGFVSLKVYDLLGREVAILATGEFKAGTHRVLWNAAGVPSGTYFYRLQSGEFVAQKKLLLLK